MVQVNKKLSMSQRCRIDIIGNILQAAEGGARKTRIMYQCNLSFRQLHAYIDLLVHFGLLNSKKVKNNDNTDSQLYQTTKKGKAFIEAYHALNTLLSS